MTTTQEFTPDYAVPPGWILDERLEAMGMSHAEFARRCGRSPKLISDIINAKAPIEPETAIQFEHVLGMNARIWIGMESDYQLHAARAERAVEAEKSSTKAWYSRFPIREMVQRESIPKPSNELEGISQVLSFFGVGTPEAWSARYEAGGVAFRSSLAFKSEPAALACWLREGEIQAETQSCSPFNLASFKKALREIHALTREQITDALPRTVELCNSAGVSFALVKEYKKTSLSGAARWLTPKKALIQLSARHKSDDHLWFSFFHEAAHIILHSKKEVFIDGVNRSDEAIEHEANEWAANFLVPKEQFEQLAVSKPISATKVLEFAESQGVAPGIVVGMLQHARIIPWNQLNSLKVRYVWNQAK